MAPVFSNTHIFTVTHVLLEQKPSSTEKGPIYLHYFYLDAASVEYFGENAKPPPNKEYYILVLLPGGESIDPRVCRRG